LDPFVRLWRRQWCGFDFGECHHYGDALTGPSISFWIFPYWSVTLPPTLLSDYLILWPQRKQLRKYR
jgi:hypothetical protein